MKDFFISYTAADRAWAEWIAWTLEEAGYTITIQAWDFRPGGNFVVEMQRAAAGSKRTLAVLSPSYLKSLYAMAEWTAAFAADPDGAQRKLVPVLVRETTLEGLLAPIIHIKLVGLLEAAAREALISGLAIGRAKPATVPLFPGERPFPGPAPAPSDPEAALDALPLDEIPLPGPLPAGSRMPLSHNPLFVGREEDLKALARHLKAGETSSAGQVEIVAATGFGGIGKTQLASEFVHRYGRFFAGGVFWMNFADASAVPIEIAACGRSLGLHSSFDTLTFEQQIHLVEEAWRSPIPRLLVFDNCEEEKLLRDQRPPFGGARILVTSRRREWDPALGVQLVSLTTLPRQASRELLRRFRPDIPETESALGSIAHELGDLPLALHLAGSFLKIYRASPFGKPAAYLKSLRQKDLLEHPSLQGGSGLSPTGHQGHVGRTFALSFQRLNKANATDALAIALLVRAAWLAPGEPIPRPLLLETAHVSSEDLTANLLAEDALRRLSDLGLIEANEKNDLLMHRLVGLWVRGVAEDEARIAIEEAILGKAAMLNKANNPADLLPLRPHLREATDRSMQRKDKTAARLCDEFGVHLWQAGNYSEARPYLERAVSLHTEISGEKHPDTANSLNNLGELLHHQGDSRAAHSCFERAFRIREKELGPEHPDTASSLNNLGPLLRAQGDPEAARAHLERALAIREKAVGAEHPDTAVTLNNLGALLRAQGDSQGARSYFERALAIWEKVLGPEHPRTATGLNNLGNLFQDQEDFEKARSFYERALTIWEKVLGPEHPDTAATLTNLASLLRDKGDFEEARPYLDRALAIREKVQGPEHPNTASALSSLGGLLRAQGDWAGARLYYERALAIREKVLGPEHPSTARSLVGLGTVHSNQGDPTEARRCLERALSIFEARLGPDHPDTKEALQRLAALPGARRPKKQRTRKRS